MCLTSQDQPGSNEDFIAIHKDAVGASEDLNPEMRSLMAMAVQFLPATYKYTNVISATREIVAGVRFNLYVNAVDANATDVVCFLDILEKPWITTDFGQKLRLLQFTNCTENGEEFVPGTTPDPSTLNTNTLFTKNREPMTAAQMSDLEGQILPEEPKKKEIKPVKEEISKTNVGKVESEPTGAPNALHDQIQIALEHIFNTNEDLKKALQEISASSSSLEEVKQRYESVFDQLVQSIIRSIFNQTESNNDTFSYEFPIKFDKPSPDSKVTGAIVYVEKEVESSTPALESVTEDKVREKRAIGTTSQGKTVESKTMVHVKEQILNRVSETICQQCRANRQNVLEHDCVKYCNDNEVIFLCET